MVSILGVALIGVLEGIVMVLISMFQVFERAWRPHVAVLGEVENLPSYHDTKHYPEAKKIPGFVILRWDAPIFFANVNLFRDLLRIST
jgi:MFS superfamily sulfate permease-like transporter